jgi:two-component system CheB/CheR fusion protein
MSDNELPDAVDEAATDEAVERLLQKLNTDYGFDFREYKRASLVRRLRARMQQVRVDSFAGYIDYLDRHRDEHVALFNAILINVTGFFRDPEAWKLLGEEVLPRLIDQAPVPRTLRVWCPGCSSGEEAYSVAILLSERLGAEAGSYTVKVYATDMDEDALALARQALYRLEHVKHMPAELLERHFLREGMAYRLRRELRRWVVFGHHNLVRDPPLSHIDLLICRNVLIYFAGELQERILARFHYAIRDGGYLFLGRAESLLTRSRWFVPVHPKWRIFQRAPVVVPESATADPALEEGRLPHNPGRPDAAHLASHLPAMLESLPYAVMLIDPYDTILFWNDAAATLYDIPADAALNRKFRDLDVSYRIEGLRMRIEEAKAKRIPVRLDDVAFSRRSGEPVQAAITITPLIEGSRVTSVLVVADDATDYARLKEQMTRVAEQHATAIEELQSTNEELETTNEEFQSTNEELEATNEELQSTNEELETTVAELQAANTELNTLNTELERRTADLRRLEEYQRAILTSLEHAVIVVAPDGQVLTWNPTAERMWGLSAQQAVGRRFSALPAGELPRLAGEAIARVQASGQTETVPGVPLITPTGQTRQAVLRLAPFRDPAGGASGVVAVAYPEDSGR